MTLPTEERTDNVRLALGRLLESAGDQPIDEVLFKQIDFDGILPTTWEELQAKGFVETVSPVGDLSLTGRGWVAALLVTHKNSEEEFKRRVGELFGVMKSLVKGRKEPKAITMRTLVDETKLPEGWIFNVIEGRYMEEIYKRNGASWIKKGRVVLVPVGFAVEPTDLETLLNSELLRKFEELRDELEIAQDELGQYKCPHCGAQLASAGSVPLDEHSEGYYQSFGCGYSVMDGFVESLCPSDPKFPRLEEFDLKASKTSHGDQWVCTPVAKTYQARKVNLNSQPGSTEQEAKQRVIENYNFMVKGSRR
jgi:hypothetical protein